MYLMLGYAPILVGMRWPRYTGTLWLRARLLCGEGSLQHDLAVPGSGTLLPAESGVVPTYELFLRGAIQLRLQPALACGQVAGSSR